MTDQREQMVASGVEAIEVYRTGSFAQIARQRIEDYTGTGFYLLFIIPTIVAMFLFGLYVGRRRWVQEHAAHARLWRKLLFIGQVGKAVGLLLTFANYLVHMGLSVWWLRRFQYGPMEWFWRSLTYLRPQPMRAPSA